NHRSDGPARHHDRRPIEGSPCRADILIRKPECEGLARRSLHGYRECGNTPRVDERPRSLLQGRRKGGRPEQSRRGRIKERLAIETRKWKAFLRMNGETRVDMSQDILTEFKAMVEYLKCIGVDYSMVVQVEAGQTGRSQSFALEQVPRRRGSLQLGE